MFRWFVALLVAVGLVSALTAAAVLGWRAFEDQRDQRPAVTRPAADGATPGNQTVVRGTATAVHVEGAFLPTFPMPVQVTTPPTGPRRGGTIQGVTVGGQPASIVWDAGRPLNLSNASGGRGGGLELDAVTAELSATGVTIALDGTHAFVPGPYRIDTSVAVGIGGLAESRPTVDFQATATSTIMFQGGTSTTAPPFAMTVSGGGGVTIDGTLEVTRTDGRSPANRVELTDGTYELNLTPVADGWTIEAVLQGAVTTA
ncbi:MAG: hypothetical protein ACRD29_09560 [Acidimicrobiales bacterium]